MAGSRKPAGACEPPLLPWRNDLAERRGVRSDPSLPRPPPLDREQHGTFELVKELAPGGLSDKILLMKNRDQLCIGKIISLTQDSVNVKSAIARQELKALTCISRSGNPNLNKMMAHTWGKHKDYLAFYLEYCDQGSLQDNIIHCLQTKTYVSEDALWHFLLGIANGLAFMHEGIEDAVHGKREPKANWDTMHHIDLKTENIFLTTDGISPDEFPRPQIGDFGCVIFESDFQKAKGKRTPKHALGDPSWATPDAVYTHKSDLWQCGAIIHVCAILGLQPEKGLSTLADPCGDRYSERLNKIVAKLMSDDPKVRPEAIEVVDMAMEYFNAKGVEF